jgi:NAD(P)-dependent dehydrogenase (short-subunit alcohol dehydrogenase family)
MDLLSGRVAIITGGGRGQGAAEAGLLARTGAAVAICDVIEPEGEGLAADLVAEGFSARFFSLDVTAPEQWDRVVADVMAWRGRVDILVNNAGIINRTGIEATPLEAWQRVLAVNLTGAFLGIKAVAPAMRAQKRGSIINISSNSAFSGHYDPAYTASKWGLRGLTKTAAMELVSHGIRVNAICPGLVITGLNATSPHLKPMIAMTPMARAGAPDEIAQLVKFLASDESSFITGEEFVIDGGFTAGAAYRRVAVETGLLPDGAASQDKKEE